MGESAPRTRLGLETPDPASRGHTQDSALARVGRLRPHLVVRRRGRYGPGPRVLGKRLLTSADVLVGDGGKLRSGSKDVATTFLPAPRTARGPLVRTDHGRVKPSVFTFGCPSEPQLAPELAVVTLETIQKRPSTDTRIG